MGIKEHLEWQLDFYKERYSSLLKEVKEVNEDGHLYTLSANLTHLHRYRGKIELLEMLIMDYKNNDSDN